MKILTTEYQSNEKMRINLQEALAKGYTHFIPSDLNIDIYPCLLYTSDAADE